MKKMHFFDSPTVVLMIALSIGLAIAVHPVFLLIGFAITIGILIEAVAHAIREHAHQTRPSARHA